jgi:outer membrane protein
MFLSVATACLVALAPMVDPPGETLSLAEALRLSASNPAIMATDATSEAAAARVREVQAARRPQVDVTVSGRGLAQDPGMLVPAGIMTSEDFEFVTGDRFTQSVTAEVQQLIWDAGRVRNGMRAADAERLASKADGETMARKVALATVRTYAGAVASAQRVDVLRQSVVAAEETLRVVRAMVEQEILPKSDQLVAQYRCEDLRAQLASAEGDEVTVRAALAALIGRGPGRLSLPPVLPAPDASDPAALALKQRSELLSLEQHRQASLFAADAADATRKPIFVAVGQLSYTHDTYLLNQSNAAVGVALKVPIFDGGASKAKAAAFRAQSRALELSAQAQQRQITAEVAAADAAEHAARQRVSAMERAVTASTEASRLERLRHGQGLTTTRDLLQVLAEDTAAKAGLAGAQASLVISVAEQAAAAGQNLISVFAKE